MDLAPVRAHADAPARPYQPVQRSQPGEHDQALRDGAAQQHTFMNQSPTPLAHAPVTNPIARAIDDAEYGGEYLPSGRSLEAALLESSNGLADRNARNVPSVTENVAKQQPGAQTAPANRSVTASEPARPEPLAGPVQSEPVRLEDDLRKVEAYLDRPNTPAIVRSEVVAAELGIDDQRSERALERLSENRDRVSRIRKGAYMVKSSATGHATRY
jgi:hypothetical protein